MEVQCPMKKGEIYSFDLECQMWDRNDGRPFHTRAKELLCIVLGNLNTGEVEIFEGKTMNEGLDKLIKARMVVAHNGRNFDIPALKVMVPTIDTLLNRIPIFDTLLASREIYGYDGEKLHTYDRRKDFPVTKAIHSLKAWGYRFKYPKMDDFEDVNWETEKYSDLLGEYCKRDVEITAKLYKHLLSENKKMEQNKTKDFL
jgi:DNA polymerase I